MRLSEILLPLPLETNILTDVFLAVCSRDRFSMPHSAKRTRNKNSYSSDETEMLPVISVDLVICLQYGIRAGCRYFYGSIRPGRYGGFPVCSAKTYVLG